LRAYHRKQAREELKMNLFVLETEFEMPCEIVFGPVTWRIPVLYTPVTLATETCSADLGLDTQRLCKCDDVAIGEGLETDWH